MDNLKCKICTNRFVPPKDSGDKYRHLYFGVGCKLTPSLRPQISAMVGPCKCPDFVMDIDVVVED